MKPILYISQNQVLRGTLRRKRSAILGRLLALFAVLWLSLYVLHVMGSLEAMAGLR
jgi:hypothetical protein